MIDFTLSEDLQAIVDTAERFAREQLLQGRRDAEGARSLPGTTLDLARSIGFGELSVPETAGGSGLGMLAHCLVAEELAAGDPGGALQLLRHGIALAALSAFGESACAALDGAQNSVFAMDLDGRIAPLGNRLVGRLPWVPADTADSVVLLGRSQIAVLRDGFHLKQVPGSALRAAGASAIEFNGVPAWTTVDESAAKRARASVRLTFAALAVGAMRLTCSQSVDYAVDRVAFGKPIAHHQALAFLIADMRMAMDGARALLHEAAWRADQGLPFAAEASSAFIEAAEAGMFIGPNGVQILGAAGFMRDGPVEKQMRELRALSLLAGGVDAARSEALENLGEALLADASTTMETR